MVRNKKKDRQEVGWIALTDAISEHTPQLMSVLGDEEDFISLFVKYRDDGTYLGVLKRYGSDGGPLVCFGTGYGVPGALVALEATIAAGNWKVDKPWNPKK